MIETTFQPTLFVLTSVLIGFLARDWLRQRSSHGLTRFLALECILALTVLSLPAWPRDPLSPMQILSWSLILVALLMAGYGYRLLRLEGKPELKLAADQQLAVDGFYKYVRHPLYSSLILFSMGVFIKAISMTSTILLCGVALFIYLTAREEEMENLDRFGIEYARYLDASKMFVPFVF
jgi:protein-S-isoprenylcysteine O-methyltransferase Ste14